MGLSIGAVLLLAMNADELFWKRSGSSNSPALSVPEVDAPAPDFSLQSLDGSLVTLGELKGLPVIINFWATWCGPCRVEMPTFQAYQDQFEGELVILAINASESQQDVNQFVDELDLNLRVLLDPEGEVEKQYRVRGLPTTYFIDESGVIQYIHLGLLSDSQLGGYLGNMGLIQ